MKYQQCSKCKTPKKTSEFSISKRAKSGLQSSCKQCQKQWRKKNKIQLQIKKQQYWQTKKDNPDFVAKRKAYYKANKKDILAYSATWRNTVKGKFTEYKSNAKKRGILWKFTEKEFRKFWQKPCVYCGTSISTIGLDRIDNHKEYSLANCVACCGLCNRAKGIQTVKEFLSWIKKVYNYSEIGIL